MNQLEKELEYYGLSGCDTQIIQSKDGVTVARVLGKNVILKYFEKEEYTREIKNYDILQSLGIKTIKVIDKNSNSVLLEDIETSDIYRLGQESDFENKNVIKALAKWYSKLHTEGVEYVKKYGKDMYDEWDYFNLENINIIKDNYNLSNSLGLKMIIDNYELIKNKMDAIPRTLTYNDFYYTNMIVSKDESEAFMFDYNLLGKGCYICDIKNVTYWYSEENKKLFMDTYGKVDNKLFVIDDIVAPITSLSIAMKQNAFPDWAKESLEDLNNIPELIQLL